MNIDEIKKLFTLHVLHKTYYFYFIVIVFIIVIIFIFLQKYKNNNNNKQKMYFYIMHPLTHHHIINTIINIFSYGFMHHKNIVILIFDNNENNNTIEYAIKMEFTYLNMKIFLTPNIQNITFYINKKGILCGISHKIYNEEYHCFKKNNMNLLLTYCLQNKKYTIQHHGQILYHIDINYMQSIITEYLKKI